MCISHAIQVHEHRLEGAFGTVRSLRVLGVEVPGGDNMRHILNYAASPADFDGGTAWGAHFEPMLITPEATLTYDYPQPHVFNLKKC